jgi:MHS family proline/betaine transporter-like MFS transporter
MERGKIIRLAYEASLASFFGTFLEFYDFTLFGYLATIIGPLFFPSKSMTVTLLYYFATFGTGFVMRPIGALFFGWLGDVWGRRNTFMIPILLMALASLFMGLLPTYQEIGVWAPALLVTLRLVQGFSLGGEWGGGITMVAELAPKERRGYFVGIVQMAQSGLLTTGLLTLFSSTMSKQAFVSYGWRILFIIGVIIAVIGFYIRVRLTETPEFEELKRQKKTLRVPVAPIFTRSRYILMLLMALFLAGVPLSYTYIVYGVTYLTRYAHFAYSQATFITFIASAVYFLLTLPFAYLTDIYGRKPIVLAGLLGEVILVFPFYFYIVKYPLFSIVLTFYIIEETLHAVYNGAYGQMLAEIFPTVSRYTGVAFSYNLGVAILGGFTPFIVTYLISALHTPLAPIYWLFPLILIALILTAVLYKETKGIDLMAVG